MAGLFCGRQVMRIQGQCKDEISLRIKAHQKPINFNLHLTES
jgi:hypothetical protein